MRKIAEELFDEGCRKVVCVDNGGLKWWTVGKVYEFNSNGSLTDDDGDENDSGTAQFEPYSFFGMANKEFSSEDIDEIANAVAEKFIAVLGEKLDGC